MSQRTTGPDTRRSGPGGRQAPRAGAHRPAARRRRTSLPVLPIAVGGVLIVAMAVLAFLYYRASSTQGVTGQPVANISCNVSEQAAVHYHTHLDLIYHGAPVQVPYGIGIQNPQLDPRSQTPYVASGSCFYWLHTHDAQGIIHIEAPKSAAGRVFTLGDLFKVWGQPLDATHVATFTVGAGDQVKIWVDGQPYTGSADSVPLKQHEQVVVEVGPPFTDPPPTFSWPQGF